VVVGRTFAAGPGLRVNGSGATPAPGTPASGSCGSDDGRRPSSPDHADESLAAVARGIRPSAKSNTAHARTNFTENRFSFNVASAERARFQGRGGTTRAVASPQMRRFVPLNYRRGWAALTPPVRPGRR